MQFLVYVLDDVPHAYYTMDQTTFPYKEQSHVDGLACCKQEWGSSDEKSCWFKNLANCGRSMATI